MKKRILISGGSGFFGRAITNTLQNEPEFQVKSCSKEKLDITDPGSVTKIIRKFRPQVIVNCSGITGNANCTKDPQLARAVNVDGVANLASACQKEEILLIHPSSVVVFDGLKGNYREEDRPRPHKGNIYSETKFESEQVVEKSGAEFIIPRIATVYGSLVKGDSTNFLGLVVESLKKGKARKYFDDQFTNPVEISDIGRAFSQLIKGRFRGIIHLGGPEVISMYQFAKIIQEEFGLKGKVGKLSVAGTNYSPNMTLDISYAKSKGIKCKSVKDGVRYCKLLNSRFELH